jgi:broad specificity phosphatase PhoE
MRTARLVAQAPTLVVTSRFCRTKQTAAPLLRKYPQTASEEWPIEEFTYLDANRCADMTYEERKPLVAQYWRTGDPQYRDGSNCESFASFIKRLQLVITMIRARDPDTLVMFTHGHVMKAVIWLQSQSFDEPRAQEMNSFDQFRRRLTLPNASVLRASNDLTRGFFVEPAASSEHLLPWMLTS